MQMTREMRMSWVGLPGELATPAPRLSVMTNFTGAPEANHHPTPPVAF